MQFDKLENISQFTRIQTYTHASIAEWSIHKRLELLFIEVDRGSIGVTLSSNDAPRTSLSRNAVIITCEKGVFIIWTVPSILYIQLVIKMLTHLTGEKTFFSACGFIRPNRSEYVYIYIYIRIKILRSHSCQWWGNFIFGFWPQFHTKYVMILFAHCGKHYMILGRLRWCLPVIANAVNQSERTHAFGELCRFRLASRYAVKMIMSRSLVGG